MQRRAVLRDVEITVALLVERRDIHAEIKKLPYALRIPHACELREQLASLSHHFANKLGFAPRNGTDTRRVVSCASGDKPLEAMKVDGNTSSFEQLEHITASSARCHRHGRFP